MKTAERNPAALEFSREAVENTTAIADAAVRVFDELGAFALYDMGFRRPFIPSKNSPKYPLIRYFGYRIAI